mgnify:CR=1 FL=1
MKNELILKKYELKIINLVNKDFRGLPNDIDDLIQEAFIGFNEALNTIVPKRKENLFNYCYQRGKWRILDWLKKKKKTNAFEIMIDQDIPTIQNKNKSQCKDTEYCSVSEYTVVNNEYFNSEEVCSRLSQLELLECVLNNYPIHHRQLLLLEFYGIKTDDNCKKLSEVSISRIKRRYKQDVYKFLKSA